MTKDECAAKDKAEKATAEAAAKVEADAVAKLVGPGRCCYFSPWHPTNVDLVSRVVCNPVTWRAISARLLQLARHGIQRMLDSSFLRTGIL